MASKIVANGIKIFDYYNIKIGDIHQWRWDTYQNLGNANYYTLADIQAMNEKLPNENMVITTMMQEKINQGYQVIFVTFDSSTVCNIDIFKKLPKIKRTLRETYDQDIYLVFVDTYISLIENKYKLANKNKYHSNVKSKLLDKYVRFVEGHSTGEYFGNCGIDFIYKVDFMTASEKLVKEERKIINSGFQIKAKNEQNDNAQLAILNDIKNENKHSKCVVFSNDRGLLKKSKEMEFDMCTIEKNNMYWDFCKK